MVELNSGFINQGHCFMGVGKALQRSPRRDRNRVERSTAASRKFAEADVPLPIWFYEQPEGLPGGLRSSRSRSKTAGSPARLIPPPAAPSANPKPWLPCSRTTRVKNHRNTEAVEVAPIPLVAARILEYKTWPSVPSTKSNQSKMGLKRKG